MSAVAKRPENFVSGPISVVLCKRDEKGKIDPERGKVACVPSEVEKEVTKGVKSPYKADALDRFYREGDYAIDAEENWG